MDSLASALWEARLGGTIVPRADPVALGDGYATQASVVAISGERVLGWKIGSTSKEAQERLGTTEPGAGALLERFCYTSGSNIPIFAAHDPYVEVEFAFVIGQTLPPSTTDYDYEQVRSCISECRPGLELVGSRVEGGLSGIGRAMITADGGGNIAFIHGANAGDWREHDLPTTNVALSVNGDIVATGNGARALDDPMNVMVWLANHLSKRGMSLNAGDIVTTGTCTGLVEVKAGDVLIGDFGPLGQVHARIAAAE